MGGVSTTVRRSGRSCYAVLSIDGGGMRGIIPALVLAEIERRTGRLVADLFDLMAGTSSGGMLALVLVKPDASSPGRPAFEARHGVALYEEMGSRIFDRSAWRTARSLGSVLEQKYPSSGIEAVLEGFFGDARLKDAVTNVLVTSYDIERGQPFFFKGHKAREDPERHDFFMRNAARATSAAPIYFEPHRIEADSVKGYYALIDGGVFAANPAMCAFVEARTILRSVGGGRADLPLLVVSLGAGEHRRPMLYEDARGWGARRWATCLHNVLLNAMSETVDRQMREIVSEGEGEGGYYRFQTALPRSLGALDNAERSQVRALKLLAERLIEREDERLDALCNRLHDVTTARKEAVAPPDEIGTTAAGSRPSLQRNQEASW